MPDGGASSTVDDAGGERHPLTTDDAANPAVIEKLRTNNFNLLRLLLAGSVVVYHTGILSQQPSLSWMPAWVSGDLGVQGFFVVSGFLVTMSYDRSRSLQSYFEKRARRIAPAYLTVVLGAAVLLASLSTFRWSDYFLSPTWSSYVFWNMLLANFMSPDLPGVFLGNYKQAVNGSLWTIKVEVGFYCFVPLMAWLAQRLGRWRVWWMMLLLSSAWRIGLDLAGILTGSHLLSKLAIQAPGQLSFFVLGAMAYERTRLGLAPPPLAAAIVCAVAYAVTTGLPHELLAPFAVAGMIYWAAITCPLLPDVGRYGDISYGVYLYHWPLLQVFIALGFFAVSPGIAATGLLITVVIVASLSWMLVEKPLLRHRQPDIGVPRQMG